MRVAQRAGGREDVSRDGKDQQPRAEGADEAAGPGLGLVITLVPNEEGQQARTPASAEIPASLVRLGRTARFRGAIKAISATLDLDPDEFSAELVAILAALAHAMSRDLAEADWWRILDALLLIATHPAGS